MRERAAADGFGSVMVPLPTPCVCSIKVTVIEDPKVIEKENPLMYLVGRGCLEGVTLRHAGTHWERKDCDEAARL
jgi:hypothetical protein